MAVSEQALTFKDLEGHRISGILASPPDPTDGVVVLCHGFLSNKNSTTNKTMTALLLERRIAVFRFDFFGQGESEGPFEQITMSLAVKQALAALDLVAFKGYRRVGLIGSSFGGLVALLTAARWSHQPIATSHPGPAKTGPLPVAPGGHVTRPNPEPAGTGSRPTGRAPSRSSLSCLALKCPVPDFPEMLELEFGKQGMAEWKRTDTIPDITGGQDRIKLQYGFYEDCVRHLGYDAAKTITAPTLIVQGDRDEYVPLHQSRRLYDALQSDKRLEILNGADHRFTRPDDFRRMTTMLADWMVQHLHVERL
ncbi:MAG TPA: alpha/beta hydrolase [Nitrospiraceae bacterium]|nr:alpha/beta hydrolase [Nitrospiraceae bacterium]